MQRISLSPIFNVLVQAHVAFATFEWNGRQVATLAKSGGFIYIIGLEE